MSFVCGEDGADGHCVDVDPADDDTPLPSSALDMPPFALLFPSEELMVTK
jgi:hypothetical protein